LDNANINFNIVYIFLSNVNIYINMGFFGKLLGGLFGKLGSHLLPIKGVDGGAVGEQIGDFLPFRKGGKVKKAKKAKVTKAKKTKKPKKAKK
jgi:hypothetical protein